MKTTHKTTRIMEVVEEVEATAENPWRVPAGNVLVIPASASGRWIGPPVAVAVSRDPHQADAEAAVLEVVDRTLQGKPFGFEFIGQEDEKALPSRAFVVNPRKWTAVEGWYVRIKSRTLEPRAGYYHYPYPKARS